MSTLRAAVIGGGHMGRHHVRIYSQREDIDLVGVVDVDQQRAQELADKHKTTAYTDISQVLGNIDLASVAVPTSLHLEVAERALESGVHVLIEKPLAGTVDHARKLVQAAERTGRVVQVGHSERFNPVVQAMYNMDITPQFVETHRISPFPFRSADVGVVMDVMIHDIDIVLHMVGSPVVDVQAVGVAVLGSHEDICNARLTFESGCVATLTASRLALKTERKIRVFSDQAYLSVDYQKKSGIAIKKSQHLDILKYAREHKVENLAELAGADFGKLVKVEPLIVDDSEPLGSEIDAFITSIREGTAPAVSVHDGCAAVECAHAIVDAVRTHRWQGTDTNADGPVLGLDVTGG